MSLTVHPFFETTSESFGFIVANPESGCCAIVDAALGINDRGQLSTDCADLMLDWVDAQRYTVRWILDTHVHADRPSATGYLKQHLLCAQSAIGVEAAGAEGYDRRLRDGEKICLGHACGRVIATPGHSSGCVSYQFDDFVFVGDALFMPDAGTARCDLPGSCAVRLYHSIQRLLALPRDTRLFVSHDYTHGARRPRFVTTVAEEIGSNVHVSRVSGADEFLRLRRHADETLRPPLWSDLSIAANEQCLAPPDIQALVQSQR